ncbi:MAG TPA: ABC-2 family transporter protein [Polyangiaceae bacterium]
MSARGSLRALPALLRAGVLEAVAYRAETVVWALTSTMPLIMLALFGAVARDGPVGRYGEAQFTAYFLATFIVRQLTSSWISWQINGEVRDGTLGARLLRPVHPAIAYAAESLAPMPLRAAVALPVAMILLVLVGAQQLTRDPVVALLCAVSIAGAWLISLSVSLAIGALAFYFEQATRVMDVWLTVYFVLSGYLLPVELFPRALRVANDYLPFRYQIGLPVELMVGVHGRAEALSLVGRQWIFVLVTAWIARVLWQRGLARFAAYGG